MDWNTRACSPGLAGAGRGAFSIVLVGNQIAEYALNIDGEFAAGEWRRIASSDAVLLHCRS
jgi:hypothetical protein